ncbi:hypothetical protein D3C86_1357210 [compost metagenome]
MKPIQLEGTALICAVCVFKVLAFFHRNRFTDAGDSVIHQTHPHYITCIGINKHLAQSPRNQVLSEIAPTFLNSRPSEDSSLKVEVEFFRWHEVHQVDAHALAWDHVP